MLKNQTIDKLYALRLNGMIKAYTEQLKQSDVESLTFNERFGLLIDCEIEEKENRRLQSRLRKAKLKQQASMEDIDYHTPRGLDKALLLELATCKWIKAHQNIHIVQLF